MRQRFKVITADVLKLLRDWPDGRFDAVRRLIDGKSKKRKPAEQQSPENPGRRSRP